MDLVGQSYKRCKIINYHSTVVLSAISHDVSMVFYYCRTFVRLTHDVGDPPGIEPEASG